MAFLSGQVALIIAKERPEWKLSGRSDLFAGESKDAFQGALRRIPFPVEQIHSDNGSEFLNATVIPPLEAVGTALSRSRPYHKNDNRFVEENNSHIRACGAQPLRYGGASHGTHYALSPARPLSQPLPACDANHARCRREEASRGADAPSTFACHRGVLG